MRRGIANVSATRRAPRRSLSLTWLPGAARTPLLLAEALLPGRRGGPWPERGSSCCRGSWEVKSGSGQRQSGRRAGTRSEDEARRALRAVGNPPSLDHRLASCVPWFTKSRAPLSSSSSPVQMAWDIHPGGWRRIAGSRRFGWTQTAKRSSTRGRGAKPALTAPPPTRRRSRFSPPLTPPHHQARLHAELVRCD